MSLAKKILVWLGLRSKCCGAKTYEPIGWDRLYCSNCERRVDVIEEEPKKAELGEVWAPSKWDVFVDNIMLLIILGAVAVLVWKIIEFVKAISV